jgi:putative intracellular protease/amidase
MSSRNSRTNFLASIAGVSALLAAAPLMADASSLSSGASARTQLAYNGCGHNFYRAPNGRCDPVVSANRDCPNGFHAVPAPNVAGYRCVQNGY